MFTPKARFRVLWLSCLLVAPLAWLPLAQASDEVSPPAAPLLAAVNAPSNLRVWDGRSTPDGPRPFQLIPTGYGGGGRFTSIALDSSSPGVQFVGSDVAGVFRSTDSGKTFELKGSSFEGFTVADMQPNPLMPGQVVLLTDDGLYATTDHGASWQKLSSQLRYAARYPGSHLMAFSQDSAWVATDADGVFKASFTVSGLQTVRLAGLETILITSLTYHQGVLYAGTMQGVYRYRNGRWETFNSGLPSRSLQIVDMISHAQGKLYLVEKTNGVYQLDPSAGSWKARGKPTLSPYTFKALAVSPANADVLLLGSHPDDWPYRLYKSTDGGVSWRVIQAFELDPHGAQNWAASLTSVEEMRFTSDDGNHVWLTDWWNVWQSSDGGESWKQVHRGLQNTVVNDIKTHPALPQTLFLCAMDNGLMVSTDGGSTWKRRMNGVLDGHAQEIEISVSNPSKMYLLAQPWGRKDRIFVYKSLDGGASWQDISLPTPSQPLPSLGYVDGLPTNLEIDPVSDDTVYVGTNGYGVFKTTDGGKTWASASTGLTTPYIKGPHALLVHPGSPGTLYASTQAGGIFKTTNGGVSWSAISPGFTFSFGMAMDPTNPNHLLVGLPEKRVLASFDAGSHWKEAQLPGTAPDYIASYAVAFSPTDPKMVVVGTLAYDYKAADGLFLSRDGGLTFESISSELPRVNALCFEWPREGSGRFLAGFNGIGMYLGLPQ